MIRILQQPVILGQLRCFAAHFLQFQMMVQFRKHRNYKQDEERSAWGNFGYGIDNFVVCVLFA